MGSRERGKIAKGARAGNRTRVAMNTSELYVDAVTTRLLVPTPHHFVCLIGSKTLVMDILPELLLSGGSTLGFPVEPLV